VKQPVLLLHSICPQ